MRRRPKAVRVFLRHRCNRPPSARPRIDKQADEPGVPPSRSLKGRRERDSARALPPQSSRDLLARANAEHDEPKRRLYAHAAQRQAWQEYVYRVAQEGRTL
jgi:hypothetical protein